MYISSSSSSYNYKTAILPAAFEKRVILNKEILAILILRLREMKFSLSVRRTTSVVSRAVHQEQDDEQHRPDQNGELCTSLTVWRKSLVLSCHGFTVIDSKGDLVYRVDNYMGRPAEVTLMDASGKAILTLLRRKKLTTLLETWLVYEGDNGQHRSNGAAPKQQPIFCVKKSVNILGTNYNRPTALAYICSCRGNVSDKTHAYVVQGSYPNRSCKILDASRRVVAEIKRKEAMAGGISFGVEVFRLVIVRPEFDRGLAMALVLLLDQMFS